MHHQNDINDGVLIALRKIIQAIDLNSKRLVRQVGLTGPQLVILQEISKLGKASVGEVAKNVSLSHGTVTGILERIEKRGFVTRQRSIDDKRRVIVSITEAGQNLLLTAPPVMQESFLKKFEKLESWEQTMILSALQRMVSLMDAKEISAAPFLSASPIGETADNKNAKISSNEISE